MWMRQRLILLLVAFASACAPNAAPSASPQYAQYTYTFAPPTADLHAGEVFEIMWKAQAHGTSSVPPLVQVCVGLAGPYDTVEQLKSVTVQQTECPVKGMDIAVAGPALVVSGPNPPTQRLELPRALRPGYYSLITVNVYGAPGTASGNAWSAAGIVHVTAADAYAPSPSATPASAAPSYPALPTKPTPCPFPDDTTRVAVKGSVVWNGAPLGGVEVEAFQPGAPGRGAAEATATTAADGSYTLTGLRAAIPYHVAVMEQPGFLPNGGTGVELCGTRDVTLAPITAYRTIEGLSLRRGATVAAGPQTLTWEPMAGADEYCVVINTPGDAATYRLWTPRECATTSPPLLAGARSTGTRYASPSLPSGNLYDLAIYALAKGEAIGVLLRRTVRFATAPIGNVGPCASTSFDADLAANMPYWFLQVLGQSAVAEIVTCLADDVPERTALAEAFIATGGARLEQLQPLPPLSDGSPVSMATVTWKETSAVGTWRSGETRWLVVRRQSDGRWALEIDAVAPR